MRMEQTRLCFVGPEVAFELVARVTGVNEIIAFVGSSACAWLEVIDGQFGADFRFANAAVAAAKSVKSA